MIFFLISKIRDNNLSFFLTQQFSTYIWSSADVNKHQIKTYFSYRLHVVPSYRERWTDWHQTPARTMISSQSPYPTATRTEISTLNRSVFSSTRSLWTLPNYWADHYLAMCTGELWISIIKPIQIKCLSLYVKQFLSNHISNLWAKTRNMPEADEILSY